MTAIMPRFVVEGANDNSTPLLRISQWCPVCDREVSSRLIDASAIPLSNLADLSCLMGSADAHAWLDHVAAKHSTEKD